MTSNPPPVVAVANPTAPIRILEVVGNAIVGGTETWVEQFLTRLPREQFSVTALCPFESPFTDRLRSLVTDVVIAPMPEDPLWDSVQTAAALVRRGGIDVLHAHLPNAHALAGLAGCIAGKPVLTTLHGRQMTMLDLQAHRSSQSHVSVVCRQSYFHALSVGVDPNRLSCEPNGVDIERFKPRTQSRSESGELRARWNIAPHSPVVGFVGRLSPEKAPDVFVRAALLLKNLQPEAHCVLVGEGPMEGELQRLIDLFDLADRVHLAGLSRDMPAVYDELDLLVSSSHSEAMPLAVMEAMASGLPVVATRVGGVPELIEDGKSGWLVPPGDFEAIAIRAAGLIAHPAVYEKMAQTARTRAVERLSLEQSSARVAKLLARIANSGGAAHERDTSILVNGHRAARSSRRSLDGADSGRIAAA